MSGLFYKSILFGAIDAGLKSLEIANTITSPTTLGLNMINVPTHRRGLAIGIVRQLVAIRVLTIDSGIHTTNRLG